MERVVIVGGPKAVSPSVEKALRRFASVTRIWGEDRYETAAKTALERWGRVEKVLIVSGEDFSHSIPATTLAHSMGAPILLTKPGILPRATEKALEKLSPREVVLLGDTRVISSKVEEKLRENHGVSRLAGLDGYETSKLVAELLHSRGWRNTYIVPGGEFQPVVVVSPIAAATRSVLLASKPGSLAPQVLEFVAKHRTASNVIVSKGLSQQEIDLFTLKSLIPLIKNVLSTQKSHRKLLEPFIPCKVNINITTGEKYHLKFEDWEKIDFLSGEAPDPLLEITIERKTFNKLTSGKNSLENLEKLYIEALRKGKIKIEGHGVKGWIAKETLEKLPRII